ncbi:CaiB/BaiF CoA transferase family protein [Chitinimonas sp. BJB300]|uniref:CaiB/BaiF CoA transferase family protein n=1 Tax=Chitinimonas sp. BJB300 TaxID=1559339 RepID=UPI000C10B834|nr:CaiB/BaiF CoA-transferase family protein [Chitinimonas sp. BJB300]PHV12283.1 CoA transferase [Chitinimonas sp. BJB300]TSJ88144.1 CoA transferase [Chitinimonas sp. BJB300]
MSALSHLRVLDLSRVLAGPWATQQLADLGAEVIKIEKPEGGDDTRGWGPPFLKDRDGQATRESAYFICANRGKKSVAIDMAMPAGQAQIRALAKTCDVVVENFKVGGLKKYGLDYDTLAAIKPDLIYCSITGFGQAGPRADQAGYDFMIQGLGGLMSITGAPDGEPQKVGVAVTDLFTGMYATVAILAALSHRDRTGIGQHIDLALFDCQLAMLANVASNYLVGDVQPPRYGNAHANIVPYQAFETRDGHVIVAVGNDTQFARFAELCGHAEWALDERFTTNKSRVVNRVALIPLIAAVLKTRPRSEWITHMEAAGIPGGPINTIPEALAESQAQVRQMVTDIPHPAGSVRMVANPIRFSRTPILYHAAPPTLGQHTNEVLTK